jgi:glyoxylase-like metal-dependent hydrolase (beta-lactamase superfamily II)
VKHGVGRVLQEGDEVAGFRVAHAPGHARGEVIYFRNSDRVAICGDVIRNMSYATGLPGVREPPEIFTYDPAVTDMAAFERFVETLPA